MKLSSTGKTIANETSIGFTHNAGLSGTDFPLASSSLPHKTFAGFISDFNQQPPQF